MTNEPSPHDALPPSEPPQDEPARPGGASQLGRASALSGWLDTSTIRPRNVALVGLILFTSFVHFWRLDEPDRCYFDEVYFPTTGAEILRGDDRAWDFYRPREHASAALEGADGRRNGHLRPQGLRRRRPGLLGGRRRMKPRSTDADWLYDPFGWRFPGALAGVGTVIFMYLLARHLFKSEVAGLSAGS